MAAGSGNLHLSSQLNAAYTVGNNVFVNWLGEESTVQVTKHEDPDVVAGQAIARSEFGITEGLFSHHEGHAVTFYEKIQGAMANYPFIDLSTTPGSLNEIRSRMAVHGSKYASG